MINWRSSSVELSWQNTCSGRRSTDDLGQFITLSIFVCVQHDAREVARRAGPSATDDTCLKHGIVRSSPSPTLIFSPCVHGCHLNIDPPVTDIDIQSSRPDNSELIWRVFTETSKAPSDMPASLAQLRAITCHHCEVTPLKIWTSKAASRRHCTTGICQLIANT